MHQTKDNYNKRINWLSEQKYSVFSVVFFRCSLETTFTYIDIYFMLLLKLLGLTCLVSFAIFFKLAFHLTKITQKSFWYRYHSISNLWYLTLSVGNVQKLRTILGRLGGVNHKRTLNTFFIQRGGEGLNVVYFARTWWISSKALIPRSYSANIFCSNGNVKYFSWRRRKFIEQHR